MLVHKQLQLYILFQNAHRHIPFRSFMPVVNWTGRKAWAVKNLRFQLEFYPKDDLLHFLFDQREKAKHVELTGFQNGLWVRARLSKRRPRSF